MILARRTTEKLSLELPYESWDDEQNIALLCDDSLGVVWKVTSVQAELISSEGLGELSAQVAGVFRIAPEKTALQIILVSKRTAGREIEAWLSGESADCALLNDLARRRADFLRNFYFEEYAGRYFAKDLDLYITLRSAPTALPRVFRDPEAAAEREYLKARKAFVDAAVDLESAAQALSIRLVRLDRERTHALLWSLLNPTASQQQRPPRLHADRPMAQQILTGDLVRDFRSGTIYLDGTALRMMTVHMPPTATEAGMLSLEKMASAASMAAIDLLNVGRLSISLVKSEQESLRTRLAAKRALANGQRGISSVARHIVDDTDGLRDFLSDGHHAFDALIHATIVESDPDLLDRRTRVMRSTLEALDFGVAIEDAYADVSLLRSLPLGTPAHIADETGRAVVLTDLAVSHLAPVWMGPNGTQTPHHLLMDRRGRLIPWSLWDTDTQVGHGLIVGPTGSGKSFAVKKLLSDLTRKGAVGAIVTRHPLPDLETNDYYNYAKLLGELAHFMHFSVEKPPDVDACSGPYDRDANLFLTNLLAEIIRFGEGSRELSVAEYNVISEKVEQTWNFHGRRKGRMKLSDIRAVMRQSRDPQSQELSKCLAMFTGNGAYAGFFDGERDNIIPPGKRLVVYELGALPDQKQVLTPLILMLFHKITRWFESLPADVPKFLLIEEAWGLLDGTRTAQFVAGRQRTYRKSRAAILLVTQHMTDMQSRAGEAILGDGANRILLKHPADEAARTAEILKLTPQQHEALRSLRAQPGYYSEALLLSSRLEGVVRFVAGPHTYWALTSDGRDLVAINRKRGEIRASLAREPEPMEVIDALAQEYPWGNVHG